MPFEQEIRQAAEKHNVPYELLYEQVRQESNFNPKAVSHCGARGLLQIMPLTGKGLGMKETEFFDVEKSLHYGALYLRRQYNSVKVFIERLGNCTKNCTDDDYWKFALASYNGGIGYTFKAINLCKLTNIPINWDNAEKFYSDERVAVRGRRPDHRQITEYVGRIWRKYLGLPKNGG